MAGTRGRDVLNLLAPPEWTRDALCAQVDPDIFFPGKGDSSAAAKRICGRCTVTAECLAYALAYESGENGTQTSYGTVGIYGATSPRQRRKILKQRRDEDAA
ncbi:WhiB family transcriptional regulator [Nocardioides convexus]|uniref:WhiB family transcriptional regulator n=1 Tax=Nocardioides convexus TaxID=2712224 RepID=UPI002418441E|nr:WhiB family transcriptional regulator [Nocardioides convexus]